VYEPPFVVDDSRPPLPADYVEHLDALVAEGRRGDAVAYFLTRGVGVPDETVGQMRTAPAWPAFEAIAHTISYDGRVMGGDMFGRPLADDPWSRVTVPTLVLDGGASPDWQHHGADALASVLPNARRITLEGQEHGAAPETLAPALIAFFSG
jgi:pimeloyl-ACP methyl ester carboxylesterase